MARLGNSRGVARLRPLALLLALALAVPAVAQEDGPTEDARRAPAVGRCVGDGESVICPRLDFAKLLGEIDTARVDLALRTSALEVCRANRADERDNYGRALGLERGGCERALDIAWKAVDPPGFLERYLPAAAFVAGVIVGGITIALAARAFRP